MSVVKIGNKKAFLLEPDKIQPVIYSTEEREIGVWTDGKPLYQKTIKVTSPSSSSAFQNMDLSSLNIDTCVSIDGYAVRNSSGTKLVYFLSSQEDASYYCFARYKKSDGNLNYKTNFSSSTVDEVVFNIQYTKTTDTAGSGKWTPQGVPAHHYSTDEQVVGTWIDGSTLYEKTFYATKSETTKISDNRYRFNPTLPNNLSRIINIEAGIKTTSYGTTQLGVINYSNPSNDNTYIELSQYYNGIIVKSLGQSILENDDNWDVIVTYQYTKSS